MIRLATHSDLDRIMVIVNEVIKEMHVRGSQQWSTDYPKRADFIQDINKRELYVYEQAGEVAGMCAFSETGHAEYSLIPFSTTNALTIKRLAISLGTEIKALVINLLRQSNEWRTKRTNRPLMGIPLKTILTLKHFS
ncbi:hypothetical protein [Halolactibacillus sp. JCM 19043]|uniref:hypothetical protein n=1 Tax=Halolactibacillus sp. JCM 19043 TaxID=1460638 RepID=UPI000783C7C2|nr:hypothetical protein [Halolactibacillus sp. JCM 19043]